MADVTSGTAIGALRYFTLFSKDSNLQLIQILILEQILDWLLLTSHNNLNLASNF